jgi:hypothetical protein
MMEIVVLPCGRGVAVWPPLATAAMNNTADTGAVHSFRGPRSACHYWDKNNYNITAPPPPPWHIPDVGAAALRRYCAGTALGRVPAPV